MRPRSTKSWAILICLVFTISMCIHIVVSSDTINHEDDTIIGWHMDTLYHPSDPNRFNVSLYYYQEIEYQINPETQDTTIIR